jgi:hypothetical protein
MISSCSDANGGDGIRMLMILSAIRKSPGVPQPDIGRLRHFSAAATTAD